MLNSVQLICIVGTMTMAGKSRNACTGSSHQHAQSGLDSTKNMADTKGNRTGRNADHMTHMHQLDHAQTGSCYLALSTFRA